MINKELSEKYTNLQKKYNNTINQLSQIVNEHLNTNEYPNKKIKIEDLSISGLNIVQKYGGTSIGTPQKMSNIVNSIQKQFIQSNYHKLYIVVSAISDINKNTGTTSKLLQCIKLQDLEQIKSILQDINEYHQAFANFLDNDELKNFINEQIQLVYKIFDAAFTIGELSIKSRDIILSKGELLSSKILFEFVKTYLPDINSEWYDLSNLCDINHDDISCHLKELLCNSSENKIVVLGGYIGKFNNGILETVGRGYSDFTAGLITLCDNIDELQILKEVDGIFSADPTIVSHAKLLKTITKNEISQLTYYGCQAVNPLVFDIVDCPIRIKNCNDIDIDQGTLIIPNNNLNDEHGSNPIAVTIKENIHIINISSNKKSVSVDFFADIFNVLKNFGIINDLVSTSQVDISIAIDSSQIYNEKSLICELSKYGIVDITKDLCILSLIGKNMIKSVGIAGKMFKTLAKHKINIEMISQGSSQINISCVINKNDSVKALCHIHHEFIL